MEDSTVLIIGGGLAGLACGIHLSKMGISTTIIEKNDFPKHKVCGEYISNEVKAYLLWLGIDVDKTGATSLSKLLFSHQNGSSVTCDLPLGGFGISRFHLDYLLYQEALSNGCKFIKDRVTNVFFENDQFEVILSEEMSLRAPLVIGAFGKRSNIDQKLKRSFTAQQSPWLAVKAHYKGDFPSDVVGLHNFSGGYCGVSKVENNAVNVCYLADYTSFKKYKTIADFEQKVLCQNPNLNKVFSEFEMLFEKPLSISQISFSKKPSVENHMLMIGDCAGLIHPLCGNGMAMAIHGAKIASELVIQYLNGEISSRKDLEKEYISAWNNQFKRRLQTGRFLSNILQNTSLSNVILRNICKSPAILSKIIQQTHGKPIAV